MQAGTADTVTDYATVDVGYVCVWCVQSSLGLSAKSWG